MRDWFVGAVGMSLGKTSSCLSLEETLRSVLWTAKGQEATWQLK